MKVVSNIEGSRHHTWATVVPVLYVPSKVSSHARGDAWKGAFGVSSCSAVAKTAAWRA